jgi:hypothetical protein
MKPIIKAGGKLVGYIRECGDRSELLSPGGKLLGIFLVKANQTVIPGGSLVGYGNLLMSLLED